jgi:hypothetical protein
VQCPCEPATTELLRLTFRTALHGCHRFEVGSRLVHTPNRVNRCELTFAVPGLQSCRRRVEAIKAIEVDQTRLWRSKSDGPTVIVILIITKRHNQACTVHRTTEEEHDKLTV